MIHGRFPGQHVQVPKRTPLPAAPDERARMKARRYYARHREEVCQRRREAYWADPEAGRAISREKWRRRTS